MFRTALTAFVFSGIITPQPIIKDLDTTPPAIVVQTVGTASKIDALTALFAACADITHKKDTATVATCAAAYISLIQHANNK